VKKEKRLGQGERLEGQYGGGDGSEPKKKKKKRKGTRSNDPGERSSRGEKINVRVEPMEESHSLSWSRIKN